MDQLSDNEIAAMRSRIQAGIERARTLEQQLPGLGAPNIPPDMLADQLARDMAWVSSMQHQYPNMNHTTLRVYIKSRSSCTIQPFAPHLLS